MCFIPQTEVYAKRAFSPDYKIVGNLKGVEANNLFVRKIEAQASKRTIDSYTLRSGLVPVQNFRVLVMK